MTSPLEKAPGTTHSTPAIALGLADHPLDLDGLRQNSESLVAGSQQVG